MFYALGESSLMFSWRLLNHYQARRTHNKNENLTDLITNLGSLESVPKPIFIPILCKKVEMKSEEGEEIPLMQPLTNHTLLPSHITCSLGQHFLFIYLILQMEYFFLIAPTSE